MVLWIYEYVRRHQITFRMFFTVAFRWKNKGYARTDEHADAFLKDGTIPDYVREFVEHLEKDT